MQERIKVWDPVVRIFHWLLVLLFTVSYLSGETWDRIHVYSGYGVLVLLLVRIAWGIVGTRHARFGDFVKGPRAVLMYIRSLIKGEPVFFPGHNPLGGWMVLALLLFLSLSVWSGLELYATEGQGPLASMQALPEALADDDGDGRNPDHEWWEEVHEFFANATLLLVLIHIIGVLTSCWLHHENLVSAMITGYKKLRPEEAPHHRKDG